MTACHESKIQFNCSRCSMKFYTRNALASHLEGISETIATTHACKYCDFKSCRSVGLKVHEKRAHLNLSIDSLYGSVKKEENIDNVNIDAKENDAIPGLKESLNDSGDFSDESEVVENDNKNAPVSNDDDNGQDVEIAVIDSKMKDLPQDFRALNEDPEEGDHQDDLENEKEANAQNLNENNPVHIDNDGQVLQKTLFYEVEEKDLHDDVQAQSKDTEDGENSEDQDDSDDEEENNAENVNENDIETEVSFKAPVECKICHETFTNVNKLLRHLDGHKISKLIALDNPKMKSEKLETVPKEEVEEIPIGITKSYRKSFEESSIQVKKEQEDKSYLNDPEMIYELWKCSVCEAKALSKEFVMFHMLQFHKLSGESCKKFPIELVRV